MGQLIRRISRQRAQRRKRRHSVLAAGWLARREHHLVHFGRIG